jgi:mannose-6-phosphate isomerase-like protein (cupin superfamily)
MATNQLWFMNTLVTIRVPCDECGDSMSVTEHLVPHGDSPPLHLHRNQDEIFCVLEGEVTFLMNGQRRSAQAGDVILAPKRVPHTYRVVSPGGAKFLTITSGHDFERFIRALGRPAERSELPAPAVLSPDVIASLTKLAAQHGIDLIGPPLMD